MLLQAAEPAKLIDDVCVDHRASAAAERRREHELADTHAAILRLLPDQGFLVFKAPYRWKRAGSPSLFAGTHFFTHLSQSQGLGATP